MRIILGLTRRMGMGMGARLGWEVGMRGRGLVMRRVGVLGLGVGVLVLVLEGEGMAVSVPFLSKSFIVRSRRQFSLAFRFSSLTRT